MSKLGDLGRNLYTGHVSIDFIAKRRRWFIGSGVAILIILIAFLVRGLNFGIEFTGGADFQVPAKPDSATIQKVEGALADSSIPGVQNATVTQVGDSTIRVETEELNTEDEVPQTKEILGEATGANPDDINYSLIGASWGQQITERGLIALGVFMLLVSLMLWIYMRNLKMAGAAVIALLHDLVLTIGVYALLGFTFTPESLIGMLTVLGYSLYDTVVVFDKVRENTRNLTANATRTYSEAANLAVNQTLVRSINTTIIGVLPVAALLFAGVALHTGPLKDLSLALFVGMIAGAYSSLFLATPLLAMWIEREPDMVRQRKRVAARRARDEAKAKGVESPTKRSGRKKATGSSAAVATLERTDEDDESEDDDRLVAGDELTETIGGTTVTLSVTGSEDDDQPADSDRGDGSTDVRRGTLNDGAAKRPQPQRKSRSERKK